VKAEPSDQETLLDIWLRPVKATHTFLTEQDIQALMPEVRDGALTKLELWVLCSETGLAIGFLGLSGSNVEALFIAPEFFRLGGGLKGPLTVDVNEQNPEAVRFYEACGFGITGRSEVDGSRQTFPLLHMREESGLTKHSFRRQISASSATHGRKNNKSDPVN
jgi:putative acetyltransferase